jgi:hypothetical protein
MKTSIDNGCLTFSDLEISEESSEKLRNELEKIYNQDLTGWVIHSHQDFFYCVECIFYLKDVSVIEDVFKGKEDLLQHLWEVYCRENKFNGNKNDCHVCIYSYKGDVTKFIVPVQSIINEITNSSSELFIVKSDNTTESILELLERVKNPDEFCSGKGGVLKCEKLSIIHRILYYIYNVDEFYDEFKYKVFDDFSQEEINILGSILKQQFNTTQDLYEITIDKEFTSVINFVKEQLGGILV